MRGGDGSARGGLAADWSVSRGWELLLEAYREVNETYLRTGARHLVGPLSFDVSYAAEPEAGGRRLLTFGLNAVFD